MTETLLVISKFLYLASATATIGYLVALVFFAKNVKGKIRSELLAVRKRIAFLTLLWFTSTLIYIVASLASILDISFGKALQFTMLRSFVTQINLGQYLAVQAIGALTISFFVSRVQRVTYGALLLILALAAIAAPIFQSHSAASGSHLLAIGTLLIHVIAISLWVGGLFAILATKELERNIALERFSQLAFWAAITVVISGVANAWLRMDSVSAWKSSYGLLIIEKVIFTVCLLMIASFARKRLRDNQPFNRLMFFEFSIMVLVLFLGTLLSQSTPPTNQIPPDPIEALVGIKYPGHPSLRTWLFEFQPDALVLAILILASLLYIKGIRILRKRGDSWPIGRTISFFVGILIVNFAINGAIGVYAHFAFSYHMIEHMILGMVAPIPLVLSAPITLALRTLPMGRDSEEEGVRNILIRFLHSRYAKLITNPVAALLIFDGSLFVLYFTGLFGSLMSSHVGHLFMNLHFLLAGLLFFHVIVGVDPNPNRPPNVVRIVILFAAMSIHAFFSIALMSATTLLDGGYYKGIGNPMKLDLLANQYTGGAIGWAMGEIPILIALTAAFIQWMRDDKKETSRIDRKSARASAMGEADDLTKYNQYLAELARRDKDQ